MTTPTHENRDPDRTEHSPETVPETRHRLDLSVTKVAAGACAAALAAAVGSQLGVAGTIVGAAVASAVATSASAVIGHSLERGKTAARKAVPLALTALDETLVRPSLADRALTDRDVDETVAHDGETQASASSYTQTIVMPPKGADGTPRTWRDRIPGRKPLIAAGLASFLVGTGAVTALEVARKGEFPGYHSNVFTNDPGQGSGSNDQPSQDKPGGRGTRSTPSQKPDSASPTPSGSGSSSPSSIPSPPVVSGSTPGAPSTPSTGSSSGTPAPTTLPTAAPTGSANPTATSPAGPTAPSSPADGPGRATPSGGPTG